MKKNLLFLLPVFSVLILIFNDCEKNAVDNNINFDSFRTYWIDSTYKIDNSGNYLIITNKNKLDSIFITAKLLDSMNFDSIYHFIGDSDFNSQYAVAIIKSREPKDYELKIMNLSLNNENLLINYSYQDSPSGFHPLGYFNYALATFDKCNFNKVYFYQNDTLVKIIDFP